MNHPSPLSPPTVFSQNQKTISNTSWNWGGWCHQPYWWSHTFWKGFLHQIGLPCLEAPLVPQKYLLVLLCAFLLQIGACSDIVSRAFSVAVSESFHRTLSHTRLFDTLHVGPATLRGLRPVYTSWFPPRGHKSGQIGGWSKTLTHLQIDRQTGSSELLFRCFDRTHKAV